MNRKDNGGPAFARPCSEDRTRGDQPDGNSTVSEQDGMSKREVFAALVLAGTLANPSYYATVGHEEKARNAVVLADALIAALKE